MSAPPRRQSNIQPGQRVIVNKTGIIQTVKNIQFSERQSAYMVITEGGRMFEETEVTRTQ